MKYYIRKSHIWHGSGIPEEDYVEIPIKDIFIELSKLPEFNEFLEKQFRIYQDRYKLNHPDNPVYGFNGLIK